MFRASLLGCLLGLVATLAFLAGLVGYVGHPLLNGVIVSAIFLAAFFFLHLFFIHMRPMSRLGIFLWLLSLGICALEIVLGVVPPWSRDALTHHLAIPKLYVQAGRILEIPFAPYAYYPMLLDMLYTPFVGSRWDFAPKLVHGLYGLLAGALLFVYLARRLSPVYGLLGFFFFVSTPAVLRLMNWAYVDLGVAFYALAALLCLMRWNEDRGFHWLIIAGFCTGFTLATKPNGLLVSFLLGFTLLFMLARSPREEFPMALGRVAAFTLLALVPFAPWAIKNLVETGNPFYPALPGWFAAAGSGGSGGGGGLTIWTKRSFLYGESWWQMAALPLRIFFSGRDDSARYFDGVLNPMLVLFLPWAFKGKWVNEKRLLFAFALFYLLYAVVLVDMRIRYILPIIGPLVILLVYGIHNIYLRIAHPWVLVVAVVALVAWNGVYLVRYFRWVAPAAYLTGRETREDFLRRMMPDYGVVHYVNQSLPKSAKLYFILMGRRGYYYQRSYYHDAGDNPRYLLELINTVQSEETLALGLRRKGLTHLVVREDLLTRFLRNNLDPRRQRLWTSFAALHLRRLFADGRYSVYRLHG